MASSNTRLILLTQSWISQCDQITCNMHVCACMDMLYLCVEFRGRLPVVCSVLIPGAPEIKLSLPGLPRKCCEVLKCNTSTVGPIGDFYYQLIYGLFPPGIKVIVRSLCICFTQCIYHTNRSLDRGYVYLVP